MIPGLGLPAGATGWLLMALLCVGVIAAALLGVARLFPPPRPPVDPPEPSTVPEQHDVPGSGATHPAHHGQAER